MTQSTPTVFLSYTHEDAEAARRIAEALRGFGIEVWFDQTELRGGDTWDSKIRQQIRACSLFIPLISANTQSRTEGYFRREWRLAVDRTHDMVEGRAFLCPAVIDGTDDHAALVPEDFRRVQWTRLPSGMPTPQFVEQVKRLLEAPAARSPAGPVHVPPPTTPVAPVPPNKSGLPAWVWFAAVVVITAGVFVFWQSTRPSAPTAASSPPTSTPKSPAKSEKSLAILPFENMSEGKDSAFFADGIHEDILTDLALVRALRVVSRTSVMQYRGTTKTIHQIAQELGVAYILEGSVRRAGNKVRVTAQLIDTATDEHVWAKNYDRDLTDVFSIQSELSQAIASALSAALSPQEKELIDNRPTENLAAYDAYSKGRELRQGGTGNSLESAPLFEEAVRLDPKFALAWAELGSTHAQIYFNEIDHSPDRLAKAKAAIDTAVRLAPDAPLVIEKLGDFYYYGYRDYTRAAEQYQRLAVLRPNDAAVFGSLGFIHRRQGRWVEALEELRRATDLEPRILRYSRTLAELYLGLNHFGEAAAVQKRIVELYPDSPLDGFQEVITPYLARGSLREATEWFARQKPTPENEARVLYLRRQWAGVSGNWGERVRLDREQKYFDDFEDPHWNQDLVHAYTLWMTGEKDNARAIVLKAIPEARAELERKPSASMWASLSGAYALIGDNAEALRCARIARDLIPETKDSVTGPPLAITYAQILAWTGDKDHALAELARLLRTPFGENIYAARVHPGWLPLHGNPRFEALVHDPKNNAPML